MHCLNTVLFQRVNARDADVSDVLRIFKRETMYACVFPCIVCAQAHFESDVVPVTKVENLSTLAGLASYALEEHLQDGRFLSLGELWCCTACKRSIDDDSLPPMAAKNLLGTPMAKPIVAEVSPSS